MKNGYQIYNEDTAPLAAGKTLAEVKQHFGFIPNALGAMAVSPQTLSAYMALDALVQNTSLSPVERHVILLAVTRESECGYCVAAHSTFAKMDGLPGDMITQLRAGKPLRDARLEALRQFATNVVAKNGDMNEADLGAFFRHGFTREQALEVVLIYANKLIAVYANRIMGTDLDDALAPAKWTRAA